MRSWWWIAAVAGLAACGQNDSATPSSGATCTGAKSAPASAGGAPPPSSCADYNSLKNVYWGDLHSHTAYSLDSFYFGNRNDPLDAYAFAKGEKAVPVADGTTTAKIDRPLDFLAVTDHGEYFNVTGECRIGGSTDPFCTTLADQGSGAQAQLSVGALAQLTKTDPKEPALCDGATGTAACEAAATTTWQKLQQAAAAANDACKFTSLVAYEWTAQTDGNNLHRNVIFASDKVPDTVFDYIHYPTALGLWKALEAACKDSDGCDVITIPHNSNYSQGHMWDTVQDPAAIPYMIRYQTLVEVFQHKGSSECLPDDALGDPKCGFEALTGNLGAGALGASNFTLDPTAAPGMVRNGLAQGLAVEAKTGQNPLELGIVGATDTHNGTPGNVKEDTWPGHVAAQDNEVLERLKLHASYNPGGITGVWAEENTRDAIFAALKRRETFATSGPRIPVRFYAIDGVSGDNAGAYCHDASFPARLVADGAEPMGQRLAGAKKPMFFVSALKDDAALDSIDIVRLAPDKSGVVHSSVHTIALSAASCSAPCVYWSDPDFDPAAAALYYARVYQVPTWRWSHYDCQQTTPDVVPDCASDGRLDVKVQERAWTSPIFIRP